MNTTIICIIIFFISLISFGLNKIPMAVTALATLVLLVITGCLEPSEALSGFANPNTIMIAGLFVVAAGFNRTQFVIKMSDGILRLTGGSFKRAYMGYILLAVILTSLIASPMVVFGILFPLAATMCRGAKVSPSKVMFPLAVVTIGCAGILPFGLAIVSSAKYNGFFETYGMSDYTMNPIDLTIGRLPILFLVVLWAYFIAPKFAPDEPVVPISDACENTAERPPLKKISEIMGVVIFFSTILLLLLSSKLGIPNWQICIVGAILTVIFGTLKEREAVAAIPMPILLTYVGALAVGSALVSTGAGELVGDWLTALVKGTTNNYILGALFFIIPFVVTQFMFNQAVESIFAPICLIFCQATGANPIGLCILVTSGCLTAYMTPMATPAIPMCMGAGGYDLKSLFKQGWLISLAMGVLYVFYTMSVFPAF